MPTKPDKKKLQELRILVVEDDNDGRTLLVAYLKQHVKDVYEAEDGEQAIGLIKSKKPDIVVTDIVMPGIDGIELITTLKKLSPHTPFIFITASKDRETLLRVIESRPNSFLTKPLNTKALLTAIAECEPEIVKTKGNKIMLKCGAVFDTKNCTVTYNGETKVLTSKEFSFLKLLISAKGSILSYELIEKTIWSDTGESMSEGALKNIIYRVRQKTDKTCIATLAGIGVKEAVSTAN
jgi:two-component system, OmpR family, response regulator VanR